MPVKINRKKIDLKQEKTLITGMILDDRFLRDIIPLLKDVTLLQSPHMRLMAEWCIHHFSKFEEAPKEIIQEIFDYKKKNMKPDDVDSIEVVLVHLNKLYIENDNVFNYKYFYDQSKNYLKKRSLLDLVNSIKMEVEDDQILKAEQTLANYSRIEKPTGSGFDVFNDSNFLNTIGEEMDSLFSVDGGAFGEIIRDVYRGDLMAIGAPMKRGKTWFLMHFALMAALSGLKVVYFSMEMKDKIMANRIYQSILGQSKKQKFDISIPYFKNEGDGKSVSINYKTIEKKGMSVKDMKRKQRQMRKVVRTGGFRMEDLASDGGNVASINTILDNLEYYNDFVADVVVVDYADILQPEIDSPRDYRNQLNHTWLALKRMAQKRDVLAITASQMGRATLRNDSDMADIAEDIRKFSHVSHWINLNQTKLEKKAGLMRVKVEGRHDEFNGLDEVVCLQCLSIGRPVMGSAWKHDIVNYDEALEDFKDLE